MSIVGGRNGYNEKGSQGSCYANPFDDWAAEPPSEKKYSACNRITGFLGSMKDSVVSTSGALVSTASSAIIAGLFKGGKYLYSRFSHKQPPAVPTIVIEEEGASDADVNEAEDDKKVQRGPSEVTVLKSLTQASNGYATQEDIIGLSAPAKPKGPTIPAKASMVEDDEKVLQDSSEEIFLGEVDGFNPFKGRIFLHEDIRNRIYAALVSVETGLPKMESVWGNELGTSFCILQAALNSQGILESLPPALRLRLDERFLFGSKLGDAKFRSKIIGNEKDKDLVVGIINILRRDRFGIKDIDGLIEGLNFLVSRKPNKSSPFDQKERTRMSRTVVLLQFLRIVLKLNIKIENIDIEEFNDSLRRSITESIKMKDPKRSDAKVLADVNKASVHSKMKEFLRCFSSKENKRTLSDNFPTLYKKRDDKEFQKARGKDSTLIPVSKICTIANTSVVSLNKRTGRMICYPTSGEYVPEGDFFARNEHADRIILVEPRSTFRDLDGLIDRTAEGVKAMTAAGVKAAVTTGVKRLFFRPEGATPIPTEGEKTLPHTSL